MHTPQASGSSANLTAVDDGSLLEAIVANTLDFITLADTRGRFVFAGKAHELSGFQTEQLLGSSVFAVVHPDDRAGVQERFERVLETGEPQTVEYRARCADGTCGWVETVARLIELGGEPYVLCNTRNVDDRKAVEQRLHESEAFLRSIVDNTFDLVVVTRIDGTLTFVGKSHELIGYDPDELLGKNAFDLMHPEHREHARRLFERMVATRAPNRVEHPYLTADGAWIWLETVGRVIEHHGEIRVLLNSRDISERKRAEQADKQRIEEQATLLKEVHHRVKNNMSTILSLLALQAESLTEPASVQALQEAHGRLRAMQMLYDNLYRSENLQRMSLRDYLVPLAEDIVSVFAHRVPVELETEIAELELSPKKLSTLGIITNELLTNAIKHAFEGMQRGTIRVAARAHGDRLEFTVADDGSGMNAWADDEHVTSFGWSLIRILSNYIGATVGIEYTNGTRVVLDIPLAQNAHHL